MGGAITGLSITEALTTAELLGAQDRSLTLDLLAAAEAGALSGAAIARPNE